MRKLAGLSLLTPVLAVTLAALPAVPATAHAAVAAHGTPVKVWLTDVAANTWVTRQGDISFQPKVTANPVTIKVDDKVKYQRIQGFGAALTDSSAWLIGTKLSPSGRNDVMNKLFDPATGIGLSMIRSPMGATDFTATGNYSYDDLPAGQADPKLSKFSVQHDVPYIIPELQQALSLNPAIKITGTPWSPPGWMKTSGSMIGGTLKPEYTAALANYFVKYVQAYRKAGVPISYITPQNEPLNAPTWPGMAMTAYTESRLVQQIGKAFADNYLTTKILGWDHNWDVPSYPETIFNDAAASRYVAGTGWHIYSGSPIYQTLAHNDYPAKESYLTEATGGTWQASPQVAFHDALDTWLLGGTRNWANGVMLWNIALDPDMGPLNQDTNGIGVCRGLVTIDPKTGQVTYNPDYYALAQVSKFVRPGARRIYSNTFGEGGVEDVAFQNPDGSKALVVYNSGTAASTFSVADGAQSFGYTLAAGNAVTFTYSGPRDGGGTPAASTVTDPTHDFTFDSPSGPATITYDPALLPIQDGVRTGNTLLTYSLPVGAALRTSGPALNRSGWTVTASSNAASDVPVKAADGDLGSRWRTGIKAKSGDWFQLDLGRPTTFSQIVLDNTEDNSFDSVAKYQVYVSKDGVTWGSAIANGSGDIKKVTITMPPQTARYVRIVSTAPSFFFHWSIGEITIYGSSGAAGAIAAPKQVPDGLRLQSWTSPDGTGVTVVYNRTGNSRSFPVSADGSYVYTLPGGTSAMFTTEDLSSFPTPALSTLTPSQGRPGYKFTISGTHFGTTQGLGTVYFGSAQARIDSWSDTSISAYVPNGLATGAYTVSVTGAGGALAGTSSFAVAGLGTPLPQAGWTVTASDVSPWPSDVLAHLVDGDTDTRYSSGTAQHAGMWIQVDLGKAQTFNKIVLDSGASLGDYAHSADVYVSQDASTWTKVSSLTADGQQVEVAHFPTQTARHLKIVNTGSAGQWWSIAELTAYAGGSSSTVDGTPLPRTGWTPTASDTSPWPNDVLPNMLDGDTDSRYTSGTGQYSGMWVQVDLGTAQTFSKIALDSGASLGDYARSADVDVSSDGNSWTKVASLAADGRQLQQVSFPTQTARYVKVVNTGSAGQWWSIAEFDLYG